MVPGLEMQGIGQKKNLWVRDETMESCVPREMLNIELEGGKH